MLYFYSSRLKVYVMRFTIFPLFICATVTALLSCSDRQTTADQAKTQQHGDTLHPVTPETENAYVPVDPSPMDMSYFPTEYPIMKMDSDNMKSPIMRVIYSRPQLHGRKLFHGFLKYGEPWRLGANESTEIEFYQKVTIQNKQVKPGRYIMYCMPQQDQWTIVLNSNIESWGLKQKANKDVDRFVIPVTHHNPRLEYFTMVFESIPKGANLIIAWEEEVAKLPIDF